MKTRSKLLIASLFAGLSLGVLSGVKFVTKNSIEPLETNASGTEFWVPINNLSNFPNETAVVFAAKCGNTWYRLSELSSKQDGRNVAESFSPTVFSCADGDVLQSSIYDSNKYFYLYGSGKSTYYNDTSNHRYIVFKTSVHFRTHRATECGWNISGAGNYYNIFANGQASNNCDINTEYYIDSNGYPRNVGTSEKGLNLPIYAFKDTTGNPYFVIASSSVASKKNSAYQAKLYAKIDSYNTITLNDNGGSNGSGSVRAFKYMKFQNSKVPTKTGYTFDGYWTTQTGGTQVIDNNGKGINVWTGTGDKTYFAHWKANTYTVHYNGNGSTGGSTADSSHTYETTKNLTTNGFTKTGYSFAGWNTKANGSGTSYSDKQNVKNLTNISGGTVTLYAKWTANTYSVKYDGNGATAGSMSNSTHTYGVAKNLTTNAFTKTGYTFEGWATNADGDVVYSNEQSVSNLTSENGAVVTLYAKWAVNTVNVDYFDEGGAAFSGEHVGDVMSFEYDKGLTLDTPTKQYFTFEGYYLNSDCSGSVITRLEAFSYANDVKLYAKWVKTLNDFAREFLDLTGSYCSGDKSFTDTLKNSFNMLSASDKELFIDTEVVEGLGNTYSSDIVEAKSRYYNMVTERGFDQFLEGMNIQPMSKSLFNTTAFFGIEEEDIPEVSTVAILTLIGGISIGGYFFLRRKKVY